MDYRRARWLTLLALVLLGAGVGWPASVTTAAGPVAPTSATSPAGSGSAWKPEELNWYGISQRRINDTRSDAALPLVVADGYLWGLAHERARDMLARGYLAPTTPEGLDAGAYMRKDQARYDHWVELLADDASGRPQDVVAWGIISAILNDAGGRAAVLGDYDRFGVALAESAQRRVYVIIIAKGSPPLVALQPTQSIPEIITAAAVRHGVDPAYLIKVARCESDLNPHAYNPAGPYIGLFQFLPATFYSNGGRDIYSPADQADVAARMFARGLAHHWGCA